MIKTRITKRKLQAMETRGVIFDAAMRLFKEKGYDNASVGEICAEAGISVGGFYHHFKNKDDIIVESFHNIDKYMVQAVPQISGSESSADWVVEYLRCFGAYVNYQGVDFSSQLIKSEVSSDRGFTLDMDRPIAKLLEGMIAQGQSRGEIRGDLSSGDIVIQLLRYARGIVLHWCVSHGDYDIEMELADAARLFVDCFRPK